MEIEELVKKLHACRKCDVLRLIRETVDLPYAKWELWECPNCKSEQQVRFRYTLKKPNPDFKEEDFI
jgi:hypothetical protein